MYYTLYQRVTTTVSLCAVLLCSCQPELKIFQEDPPRARTLPSRTGHLSSHHPHASHPAPNSSTHQATSPHTPAPPVSSNHSIATSCSSIAPPQQPTLAATTLHKPSVVVKTDSQESADSSTSSSTANTSQASNNVVSVYPHTFTTSSGAQVRFQKADGQWKAILQSAPNTIIPQHILPVVSNQPVGPFMAWLQDQDPWTSRARVHVLSTAVTPYLPCVYLGKGGLAGGMPSRKRPIDLAPETGDPLAGLAFGDSDDEDTAMPDPVPLNLLSDTDNVATLAEFLQDIDFQEPSTPAKLPTHLQASIAQWVATCLDPDPAVREAALAQLAEDAQSTDQEKRSLALETHVALATKNPDLLNRCLQSLLTVCQCPQKPICNTAFQTIGRLAWAQPVPVLDYLQTHASQARAFRAGRDAAIKAHVAYAQAITSETSIVPCAKSLLAICQDPESSVRHAAADALNAIASIYPEQVLTCLEEAVRETHIESVSLAVSHVLVAVAKTASGLADRCAHSLLVVISNQPDGYIRQIATRALRTLVRMTPQVVHTLQGMEQRMDQKRVRQAIYDALTPDFPQPVPLVQLPYLRDNTLQTKTRHYITRNKAMAQLRQLLEDDHGGICVISGPGGSGKSTLAAHYTSSIFGHPQLVGHSVEASTREKLVAALQQIARELNINIDYRDLCQTHRDDLRSYQQTLCQEIYQAIAQNGQRILLILENAQDPALVGDCMLHNVYNNPVKVIITTRDPNAFSNYKTIELSTFTQEEGKSYVVGRLTAMDRYHVRQGVPDATINDLLDRIGLMPFDLEKAMNYLQAYEFQTIPGFLQELQNIEATQADQRPGTISPVTLGLSQLRPLPQQLMRYSTQLDGHFISGSLLLALLELDPNDHVQLQEVITPLKHLSLTRIVANPDAVEAEQGIQIHQAVQQSCRNFQGWSAEVRHGDEEVQKHLLRTLLSYAKDDALPSTWSTLLRHGRVLFREMDRAHVEEKYALSQRLAQACQQLSLFEEGSQWAKQALSLAEVQYPNQDHVDLAQALRLCGATLVDLGQHEEALPYKKRALAMQERLYKTGKEDASQDQIARSKSDVASSLSQLSRYKEALECQEEVLALRKALWPASEGHPEIAHTLNSIGELKSHLGDYEKAMEYKKRALKMRQHWFPNQDHPAVARSLASVGIGYEQLARLPVTVVMSIGLSDEQIAYLQQALEHKKAALTMRQALSKGRNDAGLAHSLNNVGDLLVKMGQLDQQHATTSAQGTLHYEEGLSCCEKALAMRKKIYGEQRPHQYTADSLNSIGLALNALGRYEEGLSNAQQALDMLNRVYISEDHSYKVRVLRTMSESLCALDRSDEASSCQKEALAIEARLKESEARLKESSSTQPR